MKAKLHWTKIEKPDGTVYRFEGFEDVYSFTELPNEYIRGIPCFYLNNVAGEKTLLLDWQRKGITQDGQHYLHTHCHFRLDNTEFSQKEFDEIISAIKAAGCRLTEIKRRPKETRFTVEV